MKVCRDLAQKVLDTIGNNYSIYSIDSHKAIIKLFGALKGLDVQKYYEGLLEWMRNNSVDRELDHLLYSLRLTTVSLPTKYHSHIVNLVRRDAYQGINTFLPFEPLLS